MDRDMYSEDLLELVRNALAPLEKYFAQLIDIGCEDQEPRRVFVDDMGTTGMALVNNAQEEILTALEMLGQKLGPVAVRRAAPENQMGVRPRKVLDIEIGEAGRTAPWAKQ